MSVTTLDPLSVAAYLRATPQFFNDYPEFARIEGSDSALVLRHLEQLRKKIDTTVAEQEWLHENARQNQKITERLHELNLGLLRLVIQHASGASREAAPSAIADLLQTVFALDCVRLIAHPSPPRSEPAPWQEALFATYGGLTQAQCSGAPPAADSVLTQLLPTPVQSYALLPLIKEDGALNGLLILGAFDATRFDAHQDTIFLRHISAQISLALSALT